MRETSDWLCGNPWPALGYSSSNDSSATLGCLAAHKEKLHGVIYICSVPY